MISQPPFAHATKIEVLHDHGVIDIEEEVRAHAALRRAASEDAMHERYAGPASKTVSVRPRRRRRSPSPAATSVMLADNSGQSAAFARDVHIPGWTCVGAGPGGYVVCDCVVATRERPDSFSRACPSDTPSAPSARSRTVSSALPSTSTPRPHPSRPPTAAKRAHPGRRSPR
ncbi:hypothetical protein HDZ31DRAFT_66144 [Schizophyllum fasciatum]